MAFQRNLKCWNSMKWIKVSVSFQIWSFFCGQTMFFFSLHRQMYEHIRILWRVNLLKSALDLWFHCECFMFTLCLKWLKSSGYSFNHMKRNIYSAIHQTDCISIKWTLCNLSECWELIFWNHAKVWIHLMSGVI